jgi:hypothetical protein
VRPNRLSAPAAVLLAAMFGGFFLLMHTWAPGVDLGLIALVAPCVGAVLGILNGRRMAGKPRAKITGWTVVWYLAALAVVLTLPHLNLKAITLPHFFSVAIDTILIAYFLAWPARILTSTMTHRRELELFERAGLQGPGLETVGDVSDPRYSKCRICGWGIPASETHCPRCKSSPTNPGEPPANLSSAVRSPQCRRLWSCSWRCGRHRLRRANS